jgi:hypothetical protein
VAPTGFAYPSNLLLVALAAAEAVRGVRRWARPRPRGGGGAAGVREPRRPGPQPPAGAIALPRPKDPPEDLHALW